MTHQAVKYWQCKLYKLELPVFPKIHPDVDRMKRDMKRELSIKDDMLANIQRMITNFEQRVNRLKDVYAKTPDNQTSTEVSGE